MKASEPALKPPKRASCEVSQIVATAQRLREVRRAARQFLLLWQLENGTSARDPVAQDLADPALADPQNHDWTLLYQGSVLDD